MSLLNPSGSLGRPGLARTSLNRRRRDRIPPTAALPVKVEMVSTDADWRLNVRSAWDISPSGVAVGLLDDEAQHIRLNAPVRVTLMTREGQFVLNGRVAHLSRIGLSPVWPCIVGVQLDLDDAAPIREALFAYIDRLVAAHSSSKRRR